MKEIEYGDFSYRLRTKEGTSPRFTQIELTSRCNMDCVHCYLGPLTKSGEEMSFGEIIRILNALYDAGVLWLAFTGGEPLFREDFIEIYSYARKKGFLIIIMSNGTLITEKIARFLGTNRPFYIEIPLNGADEETYERISAKKGSFRQCIEGLTLLKKYRVPFSLKTKALLLNYKHLKKIRTFASQFRVPYSVSANINLRIDGNPTPLGFRLDPEKMAEFLNDGEEASGEEGCYEHYNRENEETPLLFPCNAGTGSYYINSAGYLLICQCLQEPRYDLTKGDLKQGFHFLRTEMETRIRAYDSECLECGVTNLCFLCPGYSLLEGGDWFAPVRYYCDVARKCMEQKKRKS